MHVKLPPFNHFQSKIKYKFVLYEENTGHMHQIAPLTTSKCPPTPSPPPLARSAPSHVIFTAPPKIKSWLRHCHTVRTTTNHVLHIRMNTCMVGNNDQVGSCPDTFKRKHNNWRMKNLCFCFFVSLLGSLFFHLIQKSWGNPSPCLHALVHHDSISEKLVRTLTPLEANFLSFSTLEATLHIN